MTDLKKPLSYGEQIDKLRSRGCIIDDEEKCKERLAVINYYRLTAYFLPFKGENDIYETGTNFNTVYHLYEFDRKLRGILFSAIEEIEVYLRANLSYFHALKYGALGYLDARNFNSKHNAERFQENIDREIKNNSKVLFVKHHLEKYDGAFPIWVIIELFTFGMISYFYNDLTTQDQKSLAKSLYGSSAIYERLRSWLRCCTDLRNICAHYGRLYYRIFSAVPAGFPLTRRQGRRLWGAIITLRELFPSDEKWNNEVVIRIEALIEEFSKDINLYHIAFPDDWKIAIRK